jgi:hypothetical protein
VIYYDESLWHKCQSPFFSRRTVDGGRTTLGIGQTWRRKKDGRWEYKQDGDTLEEYAAKQLV